MKVRNGNTPIPLPEVVKNGDAITAKWANSIRLALERLRDRTPILTGMGGVGGTTSQIFPFEIYVSSPDIIGNAGVLDGAAISDIIEVAPADGVWYLEAQMVINATTGAVTSRDVVWTTTEGTATDTDFFLTIGEITVTGGVPDATTIVQYNYGPLLTQRYGAITEKFAITIF